jgi:hypothetical protein
MNTRGVEEIANALLYEGYILYPYRASALKNRQRFSFGVVYPKPYAEASAGIEPWTMQTECLISGNAVTRVDIKVRCLQLVDRIVHQLLSPVSELPGSGEPEYRRVDALALGEKTYYSWQEAVEREVSLTGLSPADLAGECVRHTFSFPSERKLEALRDAKGEPAGLIVRQQYAVDGALKISAHLIAEGAFKIRVRILNLTFLAKSQSREEALLSSLVSAHTILGVEQGEFVSLLDPPEALRGAAASCANIGTYPVMAGEKGQHQLMLSSPIILYDYPEIAGASAGQFFDGTEIDEMLALRVMTLTDQEKREMRDADDHSRELLRRVEGLPPERLLKLHGTMDASTRRAEDST